MRRFLPALLAAAGFAAAPAPAAETVPIALSSFHFAPSTIHLKAGAPVTLHLVNASGSGHDFTAPAFFAAARIAPDDAGFVQAGSVELHGGQTRDIHLTPARGRYKLKCGHFLHKTMGMSGTILVD